MPRQLGQGKSVLLYCKYFCPGVMPTFAPLANTLCLRLMNILHTSDWHLGRTLYGRRRYDEFAAFLDWLAQVIEDEHIDTLLVAGDVFDSSTPAARAQELYYRFLYRVARSGCRHTVIIGGNHDSPAFLDAPKDLLKAMQVHVAGHTGAEPGDDVLVLRNAHDEPELIVCAVPYLRDRDIRLAQAGESIEDKERNMVEGIRGHYAEVGRVAEEKQATILAGQGKRVPIIGMGHLFAAGGATVEGDGVRELYVGSLVHVPASLFPACFDYLALGHLHAPQLVGKQKTRRYSGSPLPMGFGEAAQQKIVCIVTLSSGVPQISTRDIPVFRKLASIKGDWDCIESALARMAANDESCWLEIIYEGEDILGDLRERLDAAVQGTRLDVVRVRNNRVIERILHQIHEEESLDELSVNQVFDRCLAGHGVSDEQRPELLHTYQEALAALYDATSTQ